MATTHIPDVIISDVMMPKRDGYELCQLIKTDERTSHIPLILLTARTAKENKLQGLQLGADDYLGKPFDCDELKLRIQNLIQSRKALQRKFLDRKGIFAQNLEQVFANEVSRGFMDQLFCLLEKQYGNADFGVIQMAEAFNMSKRQLQRKIKALSDMTPTKILQQSRLEKSKELLSVKGAKVAEVWFRIGFSSHSYFNKRFKEQFKITPTEFQTTLEPPS